jgi:Protein of unknown function (DUF2971)
VRFSPPTEFNDTFDTQYSARATDHKERLQHDRFRSGTGILCLTETADDPVMWTHYAHNHTGFVVGFDGRSEFFRDDARQLGPVHYTEPGTVDLPKGLSPDLHLCFYKAPDWKTEREWRCVRTFESRESRLVFFGGYLTIREVIFGHKADESLIGRVLRHLSDFDELAKGVQFYVSTPDQALWKFSHPPRTYSLCQHCTGKGYTDSAT